MKKGALPTFGLVCLLLGGIGACSGDDSPPSPAPPTPDNEWEPPEIERWSLRSVRCGYFNGPLLEFNQGMKMEGGRPGSLQTGSTRRIPGNWLCTYWIDKGEGTRPKAPGMVLKVDGLETLPERSRVVPANEIPNFNPALSAFGMVVLQHPGLHSDLLGINGRLGAPGQPENQDLCQEARALAPDPQALKTRVDAFQEEFLSKGLSAVDTVPPPTTHVELDVLFRLCGAGSK